MAYGGLENLIELHAGHRAVTAPDQEAALRPEVGPRIGELDGVRALAIWMVLILHAVGTQDAFVTFRDLRGWKAALWIIVQDAGAGVDLFFVLSGFLITGILFDTKARDDYYRIFYIRRALRILPLFLTVLVAVTLVFHGSWTYFALAVILCANLAPLIGVSAPIGAGAFWSLAVEEQFYLLWPMLARRLSVARFALVAAAIVVATPTLRFLVGELLTRYVHGANILDVGGRVSGGTVLDLGFQTLMRCDGLALGALVALWVRQASCDRRSSSRLASLRWVWL